MNERVLETLDGGKGIRLRWSMYLDGDPDKAIQLALRELWVNSADELTFHAIRNGIISIETDTTKRTITVRDNGTGIPVEKLEDACLVMHTGSNFHNRKGNLAGANGAGLKAVCHTAEQVVVKTRSAELCIKDIGEEGGIHSRRLLKSGTPGCSVEFWPLKSIYGDAWLDDELVIAELEEAAKFYPNIMFCYNGKRIWYPKGLHLPNTLAFYESENVILSLALDPGDVKFYANRLHVPDGGKAYTHFKTILTKSVNESIDFKVSGAEIQKALSGYLSIYVDEPVFSNQQKSSIGNTEHNSEISRAIKHCVEQLKKSKEWQGFIKRLELESKAEAAAEKARQKILGIKADFKKKAELDNTKLIECSGKTSADNELYICEGLSAGGTLKSARQSAKNQAIFLLRGKIINVYKSPYEKILQNKEMITLVKALGGEIGDAKFIIQSTKLRYGKIILAADADADGLAIEALLLAFLFKYAPKIIEDGKVFKLAPALFEVQTSKGSQFFQDQASASKVKGTMLRHKGWGSMSATSFNNLAMNPATRQLIQITLKDKPKAEKAIALMDIDASARHQLIEGEFSYE